MSNPASLSATDRTTTALAELSTRQIAETEQAQGLQENAKDDLEKRTGKKVVTSSNFLPSVHEKGKLK